ncbi:L-serine ammonia-lyase [Lacibacterium aquatile]|uniref:L-serine dehydratase n=1 Tax=Lacibacterium aquatile TaxID=1168082 RepID=A0ABW5DLC6_9PROT
MTVSLFDLFKIGLGPSSSHTVGPMKAAQRFAVEAHAKYGNRISRVVAELYGSLALTGKGHATDKAVILGLAGELPDLIDPERADPLLAEIRTAKVLVLAGQIPLPFVEGRDLVFRYDALLPHHTNGMRFLAFDADGQALTTRITYSIGGGFIIDEEDLDKVQAGASRSFPYPFSNGKEMLAQGRKSGLKIAEMVLANECVARSPAEIDEGIDRIWQVMQDCVARGLTRDGQLPGGLNVQRRAKKLAESIEADRGRNTAPPTEMFDRVSLYAIAVNEENAAGGRVVTAPTNGAAGIVPAVLHYYSRHCPGADRAGIATFMLTATAIGGLFKTNASISGAEVGCQGEVGVACSMAAAGLCAALGGTNEQIENAAEIGMEHHLGMTCDPIGGLVQIPCIERNAFGAIKAINAASLALKGDGTHKVSLDQVIETMRQTGLDMMSKYKETAQGGLAVNVVEC